MRGRAALLMAIGLVGGGGEARASNPTAVYCVPSKVEILPGNQVVIHGAFFYWQNGGHYTDPTCGYMYFKCQPGQESMCQMQWTDLQNDVGQPGCYGFGDVQMMTSATLRADGKPLATPDSWALGTGIAQGVYVDGKCDPARMLSCPVIAVPDAATSSPVDLGVTTKPPAASGCAAGGPPLPASNNAYALALLGLTGLLVRSRSRHRR